MATRIVLFALLCVSFLHVASAHFPYVPRKKMADSDEWVPGHWKTCTKHSAQGVAVCKAIKRLVDDDVHFWNRDFIEHAHPPHHFKLPSLCTMKPDRDVILSRVEARLVLEAREKKAKRLASYDAEEEEDEEERSSKCDQHFAAYKMCNEHTVHFFEDVVKHLNDIEKTFKPLVSEDVASFTEDLQCKHICTAVAERMMYMVERALTREFRHLSLRKYREQIESLNCETVAASAKTVWLETDQPDGSSQFYNVLTGVEQPDLPTKSDIVTVQRFPAKSLKRSVCKAVVDQWILSVRTRIGSDPTPASFFDEVCQTDAMGTKLGGGIAHDNIGWIDRCSTVASAVGSYYAESRDRIESLVTRAVETNEYAELTKSVHQMCDADFVRSNIHAPLADRSTRKHRLQCPKTYGDICDQIKTQFMSSKSLEEQFAASKTANPFSCSIFAPTDPAVCTVDCQEVSAAMSSILQPLDAEDSLETFTTGSYLESVQSLPCDVIVEHFKPKLWEPMEEISSSNQLKKLYVNRATNERVDGEPTHITSRFSHCSMTPEAICNQLGVLFQQYAYTDDKLVGSCDMDNVKEGLAPRALQDETCQRRCELLSFQHKWSEELKHRAAALKRIGEYQDELAAYAEVLKKSAKKMSEKSWRLFAKKEAQLAKTIKQKEIIAAAFRKLKVFLNDPIFVSILKSEGLWISEESDLKTVSETVEASERARTNEVNIGISVMRRRQEQARDFQRSKCMLREDGIFEARELPPLTPKTPSREHRSLSVEQEPKLDISEMQPPEMPVLPMIPPPSLQTPPMNAPLLLSERLSPSSRSRHMGQSEDSVDPLSESIQVPTLLRSPSRQVENAADAVSFVPYAETPKEKAQQESSSVGVGKKDDTLGSSPAVIITDEEENVQDTQQEMDTTSPTSLSTDSPYSSVESIGAEQSPQGSRRDSRRELSGESSTDLSVELPRRGVVDSESSLESSKPFLGSESSSRDMSIESIGVDDSLENSSPRRPPALVIDDELYQEPIEVMEESVPVPKSPVSSTSHGSRLDSSISPSDPPKRSVSPFVISADQFNSKRTQLRSIHSTPPPVRRELPPAPLTADDIIKSRRKFIEDDPEEEEDEETEDWD